MNLPVNVVLVVVLVCVHNSSGYFWRNMKVHCYVSLWSEWTALTASAPGGTRTRTRTVITNPRNGGIACPALTETVSPTDPWDRQNVSEKFHDKFITGHAIYYNFRRTHSMAKRSSGHIDLSHINAMLVTNNEHGPEALTLLQRDLLFIIDMSGSISQSQWTLTKRKVADLIARICGSIGPGRENNRIAIVTFSSRVILNFDFKTHWTIASVRDAILRMPQERQMTCTGDAFVFANRYMFESDTGIRSDTESVKEVLVLTDGQSNCGADLSQNVRRLQAKAFVFAMTIGDYNAEGKGEIETMVSRPLMNHIFSLGSYPDFREMVDDIMEYPDNCMPLEFSF